MTDKPVVYTGHGCQPCKAVKRWLQDRGVEYEEKDAVDHVDELRSLGVKISLPVVMYRGIIIHGFNPNELKKALSID